MEKYLNKTLQKYIAKNDILIHTQYGFREKIGTSDLLKDFFDYVYENLDNGKFVLALFIDFTRAFETMNHSILLDRLYSIGVRGRAYDLVNHYLLDRYQVVGRNTVQQGRLSKVYPRKRY